MKRRKPPQPFEVEECLAFADEAFSKPPTREDVERVKPRGHRRIARFAVPLRLCKPFNQLGRAGTASQGWALGKAKKECFQRMQAQWFHQRHSLTPTQHPGGRFHVLAVRFSSMPSDGDSGWSKNPVDRLRGAKHGLGIIPDDSRRHIRLDTWWEYAPPKKGFVLVEVWATSDRNGVPV